MIIYKFAIIMLLLIILCYHTNVGSICNGEPEYYKYIGKNKGPTILILGTTHGNEQAGYYIIKNLMNDLNSYKLLVNNGNIICVPTVNLCGFKVGSRYNYLFNDINRNYESNNPINKTILDLIKESDIIIDIHEGWGFNKINNRSIGSTITTNNFPKKLEDKIITNINSTIIDDNKKFSINKNNMNKSNGTLFDHAKNKNKQYVLIELTGQNNVQPLELRIAQGTNIIMTILKDNKVI